MPTSASLLAYVCVTAWRATASADSAAFEHGRADDRHALRQAAYQRGEAERSAKRRAGQHAAAVSVAEGLRHRRAVAQQSLLVMQDELGFGRGARGGEAQHARIAVRRGWRGVRG